MLATATCACAAHIGLFAVRHVFIASADAASADARRPFGAEIDRHLCAVTHATVLIKQSV